jgi:hypothetical protein
MNKVEQIPLVCDFIGLGGNVLDVDDIPEGPGWTPNRAARGPLQPHQVLHERAACDAAQVYDEACAREDRVVVDTRVDGDDQGEVGVLQCLLQRDAR